MTDRMEAAQRWAERFTYQFERKDRWTIAKGDDATGDCEDLALGVAYILAGRSLPRMLWMIARREAEIFTGNSLYSGVRHAALRYRGLWIDTGHRYWSEAARLDGARRVTAARILRELGYGRHMRIGAAALLGLAAALFAATVRAETVAIKGTTITLQEGWESPLEVEMWNHSSNDPDDTGTARTLTHMGVAVAIGFAWDVGPMGPGGRADRLTVTPPEGWVCEPAECSLDVPEWETGVIRLHRAGVGM